MSKGFEEFAEHCEQFRNTRIHFEGSIKVFEVSTFEKLLKFKRGKESLEIV